MKINIELCVLVGEKRKTKKNFFFFFHDKENKSREKS